MKQSKYIQQPQNHGNDHDAIQNRLDGSLHWNETIHQPQQDTHYDENFQNLIKGMIIALLCFAGQNRTNRGTYCSELSMFESIHRRIAVRPSFCGVHTDEER